MGPEGRSFDQHSRTNDVANKSPEQRAKEAKARRSLVLATLLSLSGGVFVAAVTVAFVVQRIKPSAAQSPQNTPVVFSGNLPPTFEVVTTLNADSAYVRDRNNGACFLAYTTPTDSYRATQFAAAPERACGMPSTAIKGDVP